MDKKVQNEIETIIKEEILPIVTKDVALQKKMSTNLVLIIKIDNTYSYFIPFDKACPIISMMLIDNVEKDYLLSLGTQYYRGKKLMAQSTKNITDRVIKKFNTYTEAMFNKKIKFDKIFFLQGEMLLSPQEYCRQL